MKFEFSLNGVTHSFDSAKLPEASVVYGLVRGLREFVRDSYADETEKLHGSEEKALAARRATALAMVARISAGDMPTPGAAYGPRNAEASAWRLMLVKLAGKAKLAYKPADVPKAGAGVADLKRFALDHFGKEKLAAIGAKVAAYLDDSI